MPVSSCSSLYGFCGHMCSNTSEGESVLHVFHEIIASRFSRLYISCQCEIFLMDELILRRQLVTIVLLLGSMNAGGNVLPWSHPLIIIGFVLAALATCVFVYIEHKLAIEPILPLKLFLDRSIQGCMGLRHLKRYADCSSSTCDGDSCGRVNSLSIQCSTLFNRCGKLWSFCLWNGIFVFVLIITKQFVSICFLYYLEVCLLNFSLDFISRSENHSILSLSFSLACFLSGEV
jgi:hypothetical protein